MSKDDTRPTNRLSGTLVLEGDPPKTERLPGPTTSLTGTVVIRGSSDESERQGDAQGDPEAGTLKQTAVLDPAEEIRRARAQLKAARLGVVDPVSTGAPFNIAPPKAEASDTSLARAPWHDSRAPIQPASSELLRTLATPAAHVESAVPEKAAEVLPVPSAFAAPAAPPNAAQPTAAEKPAGQVYGSHLPQEREPTPPAAAPKQVARVAQRKAIVFNKR
jgi:hypothetical protein